MIALRSAILGLMLLTFFPVSGSAQTLQMEAVKGVQIAPGVDQRQSN